MSPMARVVGSIDVGSVLKQVIKISNVFTRGALLFYFLVIDRLNGSSWQLQSLTSTIALFVL